MWIFSISKSNTIILTVHTSYYSVKCYSVLIIWMNLSRKNGSGYSSASQPVLDLHSRAAPWMPEATSPLSWSLYYTQWMSRQALKLGPEEIPEILEIILPGRAMMWVVNGISLLGCLWTEKKFNLKAQRSGLGR